jgi:hypothetical protein
MEDMLESKGLESSSFEDKLYAAQYTLEAAVLLFFFFSHSSPNSTVGAKQCIFFFKKNSNWKKWVLFAKRSRVFFCF